MSRIIRKPCLFLTVLMIVFSAPSSDGRLPQKDKSDKVDSIVDRIECKDENGSGIPWFIAYKLPKMKSASSSNFRQGTGYVYIIESYKIWSSSDKPIGDLKSIVGQTIRPYVDFDSGLVKIIYNDQPPDRDAISGNGHSKGIILANAKGGIWLFHSVPKFPMPGTNFYPSSGLVNAQMFLCLTLSVPQVDSLADTFNIIRPNLGNSSIPGNLKEKFPKLQKFLDTKRFTNSILNATSVLNVGQLNFKVFAKSPKFQKEIYMDWIAPALGSNLEVQSCRAGQGVLESNCSAHSYKVYNIAEKRIDGNDFGRQDHSKWLVTENENSAPSICISDLNRMRGQMNRGGSTLCTTNKILWMAFKTTVLELQPCPRTSMPYQ